MWHVELQHQVQIQQHHDVLTTTTTTQHGPKHVQFNSPHHHHRPMMTDVMELNWGLEGWAQDTEVSWAIKVCLYIYIYIVVNTLLMLIYYILHVQMETTRTNGHTSITYQCPADEWDSRHNVSQVPSFFFLLLPRTWTTNEEQGLRRQHVLSLGMFLIYCFFKKFLLLL